MKIIGCDPGKKGGVAVLNEEGGIEVAWRMPLVKMAGGVEIVDALELDRRIVLAGVKPQNSRVVIERVGAMPKQGLASTFTFGRITGQLEGYFLGAGYSVCWYSPATWKRAMKLTGGKNKQPSLDAARLRWPAMSDIWRVKANDGIAEAALIAAYHRECV